jgi:hypothetical protein
MAKNGEYYYNHKKKLSDMEMTIQMVSRCGGFGTKPLDIIGINLAEEPVGEF